VAREEAEFAAAIRSMRVSKAQVDVFAGAGIVVGSDAEREWAELEDKISGVLHLLSA
jgi:menaquinone-specific isochorismate synthase